MGKISESESMSQVFQSIDSGISSVFLYKVPHSRGRDRSFQYGDGVLLLGYGHAILFWFSFLSSLNGSGALREYFGKFGMR